jgi:hypothetical protein
MLRSLVVLSLLVTTAAVDVACDPVKMPYEMPGPIGCGRRDPRQSGPSMLSVAQQTALKNQGMPAELVDNDKGGKTWIYVRQAGSVFGEQETAEMFIFDDKGLLTEQKTEIRKSVGK